MALTKKLGFALLASGVVLPAIVYLGARIYLADLSSYGGPPDQGAMLMAYFAFMFSLAVGGCMALAGLALLIIATRNRSNAKTEVPS
jgi:hypothetical protein